MYFILARESDISMERSTIGGCICEQVENCSLEMRECSLEVGDNSWGFASLGRVRVSDSVVWAEEHWWFAFLLSPDMDVVFEGCTFHDVSFIPYMHKTDLLGNLSFLHCDFYCEGFTLIGYWYEEYFSERLWTEGGVLEAIDLDGNTFHGPDLGILMPVGEVETFKGTNTLLDGARIWSVMTLDIRMVDDEWCYIDEFTFLDDRLVQEPYATSDGFYGSWRVFADVTGGTGFLDDPPSLWVVLQGWAGEDPHQLYGSFVSGFAKVSFTNETIYVDAVVWEPTDRLVYGLLEHKTRVDLSDGEDGGWWGG